MFLGEIASLITAVCWSFTAIFFSYSGRQVGSAVVNRSRLLFAMAFVALTHLILEGTLFPTHVEPFRWGWLAISSILGLVLGDTFLFQAYVLVGPRLSMLMMSSVPILSTFMGWVFLGETISQGEMIGILLAVGGIAWVVTEKQNGQNIVAEKDYTRGLLFGFLGAIGQATNLVTAKFGLVDGFPTISASAIRILIALVILWALTALRGQVGHTVGQWRNRRAFPAIIAGTIVGPFLGIWFSLIAVQLTRVGIAATLMALPPVILIPLGVLFYHERVSLRGAAGTLVAFLGVAVILL